MSHSSAAHALATPLARPSRERVPLATHLRLDVSTSTPTAFVDLTTRLARFVSRSGIRDGLLAVHTLHTTTAVVLNEDEPLLRDDFVRQMERLTPTDAAYAHDDPARRQVNVQPGERVNGHAHCRALNLGASLCLSVVDGALLLGRWQRVLFVDLDGPQLRQVAATIVGAGR